MTVRSGRDNSLSGLSPRENRRCLLINIDKFLGVLLSNQCNGAEKGDVAQRKLFFKTGEIAVCLLGDINYPGKK